MLKHQAAYSCSVNQLSNIVMAVCLLQSKKGVKLLMIGETLDGHDLDLLQFGESAEGKKKIWIIHRQHPGEHTGSSRFR